MFEIRGNNPPTQVTTNFFGNYNSTKGFFGDFLSLAKRRIILSSIFILIFLIYLPLLPIILIFTIVLDFLTKTGYPYSRVALFFLHYLLLEMSAIFVYAPIALICSLILPRRLFRRIVFTMQYIWGQFFLFRCSLHLLGIKIELEDGAKEILNSSGPIILFMRHSSFADTLIPQGIFSTKYRMRYILKRELLKDPLMDYLGNHTPNFFLSRNAKGEEMVRELESIGKLTADFEPGSNVIITIWPEGTRFSSATRTRVLEKLETLAEKNSDNEEAQVILAGARAQKHTLPPRVGGVLALLERNDALPESSRADVVFCTHYGFELARDFPEFVQGVLNNVVVPIKFWRVRHNDIPKTRLDRVKWIYGEWKKIDDFVSKCKEEHAKQK